jgi:hypothetical protein
MAAIIPQQVHHPRPPPIVGNIVADHQKLSHANLLLPPDIGLVNGLLFLDNPSNLLGLLLKYLPKLELLLSFIMLNRLGNPAPKGNQESTSGFGYQINTILVGRIGFASSPQKKSFGCRRPWLTRSKT